MQPAQLAYRGSVYTSAPFDAEALVIECPGVFLGASHHLKQVALPPAHIRSTQLTYRGVAYRC